MVGLTHRLERAELAGAVVAEAVLSLLEVEGVQVCPWALREGIILRRLDWMRGET